MQFSISHKQKSDLPFSKTANCSKCLTFYMSSGIFNSHFFNSNFSFYNFNNFIGATM